MALLQLLYETLEKPTFLGVCSGVFMFLGPIWISFLVGVIAGWLWKPRWASEGTEKLTCSLAKSLDLCSSSIALPSNSVLSPLKSYASLPCLNSLGLPPRNPESLVVSGGMDKEASSSLPMQCGSSSSASKFHEEISNDVTLGDLRHLWQLVEEKDGGLPWIQMMDRSLPTMFYQAWRREPKEGPPQYRTRTVYEDATPEIVRDFFWDDEFRYKWDDMHVSSQTILECSKTGTMKVQWVRKFPFFCKDREYIIARRIWDSGRAYYCVTKGSDSPSIPRRHKPRRVDLYYSSWCIRAAESNRTKDQMTACEVILFHHEDMGIPWEIAKLGIKQGMWATVLKIEPGLRAYQEARASRMRLSRPAFMAQVNTRIDPEYLRSSGTEEAPNGTPVTESVTKFDKPQRMNIPKILILGGAVALVCTLDVGLVTKVVTFGVARRFANMGNRL